MSFLGRFTYIYIYVHIYIYIYTHYICIYIIYTYLYYIYLYEYQKAVTYLLKKFNPHIFTTSVNVKTRLSKKDNVGGMGQHQKIFANWLYCISELSHYSKEK